jgi:putative ABC transport system substrate-binding protein
MLLLALAGGASAQVLVVLSDESAGYQEVAREFRDRLAAVSGGIRVDVTQRLGANDASIAAGSYALVVTVGLAAAQSVVQRQNTSSAPVPTLCLLIPRQSFERLAASRTAPRDRRLSALFIDQPLSRQLDLLRAVLPDKHRVGVIYGPTSRELADELRDKAHARRLTVEDAEVAEGSGVYGALQKILPESDVLLALPDPVAVNASTVYGLLLTSYRAQVPVAGFSESWVKAGALVSLFSTARQQGRQGAEIASRALVGETALPSPQYPKYFTVRVNGTVARSLGLHIEDEATIADALARRDERIETLTPRGGNPPALQGKP